MAFSLLSKLGCKAQNRIELGSAPTCFLFPCTLSSSSSEILSRRQMNNNWKCLAVTAYYSVIIILSVRSRYEHYKVLKGENRCRTRFKICLLKLLTHNFTYATIATKLMDKPKSTYWSWVWETFWKALEIYFTFGYTKLSTTYKK